MVGGTRTGPVLSNFERSFQYFIEPIGGFTSALRRHGNLEFGMALGNNEMAKEKWGEMESGGVAKWNQGAPPNGIGARRQMESGGATDWSAAI